MRWCGSALKTLGSFFQASRAAWKGVRRRRPLRRLAMLCAATAARRCASRSATVSHWNRSTVAPLRPRAVRSARPFVQGRYGAPPELGDARLLRLAQDRAAPRLRPHGRVLVRGPLAPLGDGLRVRAVPGGEGAGRRLVFGSDSRRRAGATVQNARHSPPSTPGVTHRPRRPGTVHLVCSTFLWSHAEGTNPLCLRGSFVPLQFL